MVHRYGEMSRALILPPTPLHPGSRGDQAVLLSTKDALTRRKEVCCVAVTDPANPEWNFLKEENVDMVDISKVNVEQFDRFIGLGTDVFDGAYTRKDYLQFDEMARAFSRRGKSSEIIGVSIRPDVKPEIRKRAAQLPRNVRITVRDPVSFARFLDFSPLSPPTLVADPAFLLKPAGAPESIRDWIQSSRSDGRLCIGVNVNRHLEGEAALIAKTMAEVLQKIPDAAFVLIPHDSREVAGDIELCSMLAGELRRQVGNRVLLLPVLSAREIKGVCALLDGIVTGRMHLAIAALGQRIPVVAIDYNSKMKGLFSYFGLQDWVVTPGELAKVVPALPDALASIKVRVDSTLGRVLWLSARNFAVASPTQGFAAYDSARYLSWSAVEHRPKWPNPINPDQTVTRENLRALLTIDYHRIEKGLALPNPRTDFGQSSGLVRRLVRNLEIYISRYGADESVSTTLGALHAYARFADWEPLKAKLVELDAVLPGRCAPHFAGVLDCTDAELIARGKRELSEFFSSRYSVRNFSDEPVQNEDLVRAVEMAHEGTPSVCNRQPYRVRVLTGKSRDAALELQNGNRGFGETINKVLLVTVDTQYFETPGERNQPWIAGGLFCMSLMYALHSLGLGTCSLNWDVPPLTDMALRERVALRDSEVLIMMIGVGHYPKRFQVANSARVPTGEILSFIE